MSFFDALAEAQVFLRGAADDRMRSTCIVWRREDVTTDVSGREVDAWVVVLESRCRLGGIRQGPHQHRNDSVPGGVVLAGVRSLFLPARFVGVAADGDVVEVTSGDSAGWFGRLSDTSPADQVNELRFQVDECSRPEGLP